MTVWRRATALGATLEADVEVSDRSEDTARFLPQVALWRLKGERPPWPSDGDW